MCYKRATLISSDIKGIVTQANLGCPGALSAALSSQGRQSGLRKKNPKLMENILMGSTVTMRQMLEAGVHFGHQTRYWSPKMSPYIFGERNKIHIINLEKSLPLYNEAVNFLGKLASRGGQILMVGTKRAASNIISEQAQACECPYVNHRWLGGMLTNFKTVRNSINRLNELDNLIEEGGLDRVNKKEGLSIQRERDKLNRSLSGIRHMTSLPDALLIIDVDQESIAVKEANRLGIPVIAVIDTNSSTDGVDYIIPGNDDSIRAIELYLSGICEAIKQGKQTAKTIGNVNKKYGDDDAKTGIRTADKKKAAKTVTKKTVTKTVVKKVIKSSAAVTLAQETADVTAGLPADETVDVTADLPADEKAGVSSDVAANDSPEKTETVSVGASEDNALDTVESSEVEAPASGHEAVAAQEPAAGESQSGASLQPEETAGVDSGHSAEVAEDAALEDEQTNAEKA